MIRPPKATNRYSCIWRLATGGAVVVAGGLALAGHASAATTPIAMSQTPIDLGTPSTGTFGTPQPVTVTANAEVTIVGFEMSSPPGPPPATFFEDYFPITQDGCTGQTLQAGQICTAELAFAAIPPGADVSGTLLVGYQTPDGEDGTLSGPEVTANETLVSGVNEGPAGGGVPPSASTASLHFSDQPAGQPSATQTVTFVTGTVPMPPGPSFQISAGYTIVSDSCADQTLTVLDWTCQVQVAFDPMANGSDPGTLTMGVTSAYSGDNTLTVALDGTGGTVPPTVVPEAPAAALLPVSALGLVAAVVGWRRRRRSADPAAR